VATRLNAQQEAIVERIVATGEHGEADAVIGEALRLLEERDRRLKWLRSELAIAEEQERRGELIDFTRGRLEELKERALDGARHGKPIRDAVRP
jgi:putative addiction module CopG family antidote